MSKKAKSSKKEELKEEQLKADEQTVNETEEAKVEVEEMDDVSDESTACEDKEDEITLLKKMWEELNDKHLRLQAEFDNYRRRTLKEKMELTKSAGESLLINLLPVMDDFERAMAHVDEAKDLESLKEGFNLIFTKFSDFLKQNNVKEIETENLELNTDVHEAITKIPAPSKEQKGKIVDCVQKGYMLNDKVIRFSKVVMGE